ncbi:PHP domain protein [Clostridiales bacterium oral taxon 876 str. F0540]|nr:PHP domain protein [Clostridiales bacterium oral taxon 876 str. F0540]
MTLKADLHMHTHASDGKLTSIELVNKCNDKELNIISITDHDTTAGLEDAINHGLKLGITVVPGIELSTIYNGESIHVLGYFRDDSYKNSAFSNILKEMTDFRVTRGKKIVENLNKHFNIELDYDDILSKAKGVIARPHIAKAIVEKGYDYSWEYIFKNIIGENSPAYVPKKNLSLEEGINLLKSVNALVVLAHPILYKKTNIEELMNYDFDGIEAIYHMNTPEQNEYYKSIARRYNKIITAGSDFHGIEKKDNGHGDIGCVSLTGEHLSIFLESINLKLK